jgi:hypothetical protein
MPILHSFGVIIPGQFGLTAYVYALKKGNAEIVKLIKDAGGSY